MVSGSGVIVITSARGIHVCLSSVVSTKKNTFQFKTREHKDRSRIFFIIIAIIAIRSRDKGHGMLLQHVRVDHAATYPVLHYVKTRMALTTTPATLVLPSERRLGVEPRRISISVSKNVVSILHSFGVYSTSFSPSDGASPGLLRGLHRYGS